MEDDPRSKIKTRKQGTLYSNAKNFSHCGNVISFEAQSSKDRKFHYVKILSLESNSPQASNKNTQSTVFMQELLYLSSLKSTKRTPLIQSLTISSDSIAIATKSPSKPLLNFAEDNKFSSSDYTLKILEGIVSDAIFLREKMKIPFGIITASTLTFLDTCKRFCISNWVNIMNKGGGVLQHIDDNDIDKLLASDMRELGIITLMVMGIPYETLKSLSISKDFIDYCFALEDVLKALQKYTTSKLIHTILKSILQKDPLKRMKPQQLLALIENNRTEEEIRTGRYVFTSKMN